MFAALRRWLGLEPELWVRPRAMSFLVGQDPPEMLRLKERLEFEEESDNRRVGWHRDRETGQVWKCLVSDYEFWNMENWTPVAGIDREAPENQ